MSMAPVPRQMLLQFRLIFATLTVFFLLYLSFSRVLPSDQRKVCLMCELLSLAAFTHTFFVRSRP